uniref:Cytochrome c oxidase subunit 4 n=1 Tax=Phallusia mammillata TaxID=59560 RepID=A0A6F9D9A5_9ASCI|nr:cytochrome c oxidase subunit 4 isoform 1, mitochondrial-like [Phallusia mammillata]
MASNILRTIVNKGVGRQLRILNVARMSSTADVVDHGLKINEDFYESVYSPLPDRPRSLPVAEDLKALKEKELGDWSNLTVDEQMDLYNMHFSMTMGDMVRGNDTWKSSMGLVFLISSLGFAFIILCKKFILPPPPITYSDEWVHASIKKQLRMHSGPITGIASKWDYENNCWKK